MQNYYYVARLPDCLFVSVTSRECKHGYRTIAKDDDGKVLYTSYAVIERPLWRLPVPEQMAHGCTNVDHVTTTDIRRISKGEFLAYARSKNVVVASNWSYRGPIRVKKFHKGKEIILL